MFNWAASPVNNSVHFPNFVIIHFPDSQTCRLSAELHPNAVPKWPVLSFTYKRKEPFKDTSGAGTLYLNNEIFY
jgi:hypothetical protein